MRSMAVAVRRTGVVLLIVGVICVAVEPAATRVLEQVGLVVSGVEMGWWTNVSIILAGRVSFIGQCLLAVGISALVLAHFVRKSATDAVDAEPQSGDSPDDD